MIESGELPLPTVAKPNNDTNPFGNRVNGIFLRERSVNYSHLIHPCHGVFVGEVFIDFSIYAPTPRNAIQIGSILVDCDPYLHQNEINGVWADDEEDVYLTEGVQIPILPKRS